METRTCAKCHEEKGLREFYKDHRRKNGRQSYCMLCTRRESKLRYYALMRARRDETLCRMTIELPRSDREALKVIARAECKRIGVAALQGIREFMLDWYANLDPPTTPDKYMNELKYVEGFERLRLDYDQKVQRAKAERILASAEKLASKLHKEEEASAGIAKSSQKTAS